VVRTCNYKWFVYTRWPGSILSTGLWLLSTYRYLEQLAFVAANFYNPFFPFRFQLWKPVNCNFSSAGFVFVVTIRTISWSCPFVCCCDLWSVVCLRVVPRFH